MKHLISEQDIISFLSWFFIFLLAAYLVLPLTFTRDELLRHFTGITGAVLMISALHYSFSKRIMHQKGLKNPISRHIFFGISGPILILFHSADNFSSRTGALVFGLMLVVVFSGFVGRYLFNRVGKTLKERQAELESFERLLSAKISPVEISHIEQLLKNGSASGSSTEQLDGGRQHLEEIRQILSSIAETEYEIKGFETTRRFFGRWRLFHVYAVLMMLSILAVHVLNEIYYGLKWLP